MWADRNPFTDEYLDEEIEFYGANLYTEGSVRVTLREPVGRCDDYLNAAFWDGSKTVPVMYIDGQVWMSLTRMEVQSHHLPILWATGDVGTIGLGLGHFTLRAMQKPEVRSVVVFESRQEVIDYFVSTFSRRPGFDKVEFVHGDGRLKCKGRVFDFLYVDPYPTLCGDDVISDLMYIPTVNKLTEGYDSYHFWGMEKIMVEAILQGIKQPHELPLKRVFTLLQYINQWKSTPIEGLGKFDTEMLDHPTLADMYQPRLDTEYINKVLNRYPAKWEGEQ